MIWLIGCHAGGAVDPAGPVAESVTGDGADSPTDSPGDSPPESRDTAGAVPGWSSRPDPARPDLPEDPWAFLRDLGFESVVIVDVDTLRADHLPQYGYARQTLPLLSARPGVAVGMRHYAAGGWTPPSVSSLLTGREPWQHEVVSPQEGWGVLSGETWGPALRGAGVGAWFINANGVLVYLTDLPDRWGDSEFADMEGDDQVLARFFARIDAAPGPFLAVLQPMEPHDPWQPDAQDLGTWSGQVDLPMGAQIEAQRGYVEARVATDDEAHFALLKQEIIDLYDEEILSVDRMVDQLIAGLEARGRDRDTLVILTADHGETLFDVGRDYGHAWTIRDELLHIPLIFLHPDLSGQQIPCATGNTDLITTLAAARGWPAPADLDGDPWSGCAQERVVMHVIGEEDGLRADSMAATGPRWRLDADCRGNLSAYDLSADPAMAQPLGYDAADPEQAALYAALRGYLFGVQAEKDILCPF